MKRLARGTRKTCVCLYVLLALGVSVVSANDPNGPVLTKARLQKGEMDESIGQVRLGATIIRAPGLLSLSVEGQDRDLLGIRIKERYMLPNGVESSFEESYPVFAHRLIRGDLYVYSATSPVEVPVHFRNENRVKNEQQWRSFLDRVERGEVSRETDTPALYITMPEPNAVEVFVSVYDEQGRESDMVPVSGPSPESEGLEKRRAANHRRYEAKKYREKATEFARWSQTRQPTPDDAATVYLQAAVCLEVPDPCTFRLLRIEPFERKPDDYVRAYLNKSLPAIRLIQLGSQIPDCDFALVDVPGTGSSGWQSLRAFSPLMVKHAWALADDGYYREAFENCLVAYRVARHLGDKTKMYYIIACEADYRAISTMLLILQETPSDVEILRWLRQEPTIMEGIPWRPAETLRKWRDTELLSLEAMRGDHPFERSWAMKQIEAESQGSEKSDSPGAKILIVDETEWEQIKKFSDAQLQVWMLCRQRVYRGCHYDLAPSEKLMAQACRAYDALADSAVEILESDISYKEKQARLDELRGDLYEQREAYAPICILGEALLDFSAYHGLQVGNTAYLNLVKAALEIRLIAAETGDVPQSLPEGLPEDPYTAEDFGYEPTDSGFILRLDPQEVSKCRDREFLFKIR